jgi:hypothetical protein
VDPEMLQDFDHDPVPVPVGGFLHEGVSKEWSRVFHGSRQVRAGKGVLGPRVVLACTQWVILGGQNNQAKEQTILETMSRLRTNHTLSTCAKTL